MPNSPPITKAPNLPEVLKGKVEFESYLKGSDYQIGNIKVLSDARLRLPLFDFPGMTVTSNDKLISHNHKDCSGEEFCLGLITFDLPKGNYIIKAELKNTLIRSIGNSLSLISILIIMFLFYQSVKNERNNS